MTEKQSFELLNRLKIPDGTVFTREEVAFMLDAPSLPSPDIKPKKKSVAKGIIRHLKNCAQTLHTRKVKMPKEVKHAPGALLPTCHCQTKTIELQCNSANISYSDLKQFQELFCLVH